MPEPAIEYAGKDLEAMAFAMNYHWKHLAEALRQEQRAMAVSDFFSPRYAQAGFDSVVYI